MPALSMQQVARLAIGAGLHDPVRIAQAVAVATAESGRDPAKVGDVGLQTAVWGPSIGLWQIRSLKAEQGKGTTRDAARLPDPAANAKAMAEISKGGTNWAPWSVTHPANPAGYMRYQAALIQAHAVVTATLVETGAQAVTDTASNAVDSVGQLAQVVSDAAQGPARTLAWLGTAGAWQRIAYFMLGGSLILIGGAMLAGRPAAQAVQVVLPVGRAAKLAKRAMG